MTGLELDVVGDARGPDVVWITGPPGVGKSTMAWSLYRQARDQGEPVLYVDIDQLEIMRPDPVDDPGRHRLGLRNLAALVSHAGTAGFARVLVSGVVDPVNGVDALANGLDVQLLRLRCDHEVLVRRYLRRTGLDGRVAAVRAEADALDRFHPGSVCIDTTDRSEREVLDELAALLPPMPPSAPFAVVPVPAQLGGIAVTFLYGPHSIGLSTVGWELVSRRWRAGETAGFVDLDQLGFSEPARTDVRVALFADVLCSLRSAGVRSVVAVGGAGSIESFVATAAGPDVVRLTAERHTLAERIADKASGGGPNLAGNDLCGLDLAGQFAAVERAMAQRDALNAGGPGRQVVVDGLDLGQVTDQIGSSRQG